MPEIIESVNVERESATPTGNPPKRFKVSSLSRAYDMNEPNVREELSSWDEPKQNTAMRIELNILECIACFENMTGRNDRQIGHSKFIMCRKRDHRGKVVEYMARFPV